MDFKENDAVFYVDKKSSVLSAVCRSNESRGYVTIQVGQGEPHPVSTLFVFRTEVGANAAANSMKRSRSQD